MKRTSTSYVPYSRIAYLSFYVIGDAENKADSAVSITNKEIMKGDKPMPNGIYDAHMGTTDYAWICHTCHNKKLTCPGHFGSIDLRYPLKSPLYREELLKWLKIICEYCGSLVIPMDNAINPTMRFAKYIAASRTAQFCAHCHRPHRTVVKDKKNPAIFYRITEASKKEIKREELYNHEIKDILSKITRDTILFMNKPLRSDPRSFIINTMRVPPNTIRPDIRRLGGLKTNNSDITAVLKVIFEHNDKLKPDIPPRQQINVDLHCSYATLDMAYYAMVKGGGGGEIKVVTNNNKAPMSIAERWVKKQGRIRVHLMGKRVELMIRNVIAGDSKLKINEVQIPLKHAKHLEIPETVRPYNKLRLSQYFANGANRYPGCKRIIKKSDGVAYRVEILDPNYELQNGDIVLRDMIDGDPVCFNRQPTLTCTSIGGLRAVIIKSGPMGISENICVMFNADFDGDTCNLIVAQNIQAREECSSIMKVSRWFVSAASQAPMIGAFQDGVIGLVELTKAGIQFDKWHAMQLFSDVRNIPNPMVFKKLQWTNRELVSMVLPPINMTNRSPSIYASQYADCLTKYYNPEDIKIHIERGKLKSGILDAGSAGQKVPGTIFHIIANEYGADLAMEAVYNMKCLTHKFLLFHGFTSGIADINISEEASRQIALQIEQMKMNARRITEKLNKRKLVAPLGITMKDYYESEQMTALNPADDFIKPILSSINLDTNMCARLILSKSKGKLKNFESINASMGTTQINGKRHPRQCGHGRTAPYFVRYDTEPDASGYVEQSYREGISSKVWFFHAAEGRAATIATALSTSISGHQNRILIKNLETMMADNMRKCVKGMNIVQPLAMECGLDPSKLEKVEFHTIFSNTEKFTSDFRCRLEDCDEQFRNKETEQALDEEFKQLTADRDLYRKIAMQMESNNVKEYVAQQSKYMPINIQRLIDDTVYNNAELVQSLPAARRVLNPVRTVKRVKQLCDDLPYVFQNENCRRLKKPVPPHLVQATEMLQILLRSYLCTKYLMRHNIIDDLLDIVLINCYSKYKKALIEPGTSIGIQTAQFLSEPLTQFALDARHRVGIGGTQTSEIVRLQEVLNIKDSDDMKSARMIIMVDPSMEHDKQRVQEIAAHIEMMEFDRFISSVQIFYEEFGRPTHPKYIGEYDQIQEILKHTFGNKIPSDLAKWCIRFAINKTELIIKSIKIETIISAMRKKYPEIFIIHMPENVKEPWIRCYFRNNMVKQYSDYYNNVVRNYCELLKRVIVRGTKGIQATYVIDISKHVIDADGSFKRKNVHGICTSGTNLSDILENPYVDKYRTTSNSVVEYERVYGIVAAQHKIVYEVAAISTAFNRLHCTVVASEMSYNGELTSIQKSGLQKREMSNVTLRLSFQMPIQVLVDAALNGLTDKLTGLSPNLIVGSVPSIGTTYNTLCVNEEFIKAQDELNQEQFDDL